jgi:hypothetical protein
MEKQTKIYTEGIERSGNVFLTYRLIHSFNSEIISNRDHTLTTLKNYTGSDPFIVPVRDALPSIVSSKIYRDYVFKNSLYGNTDGWDTNVEIIIARYKEYMEFLLDHPKFFIAPFDEFTKDHDIFLDVLVSQYPHLEKKKSITQEELLKKIYKWESQVKIESKNPAIGNVPRQASADKEKITEEILLGYSHEIKEIQKNIDLVYKRYYIYKKSHLDSMAYL